MTTEKEQLEAEIAKRDARIAELERQGAALAASYCDGVLGDSYGHAYCKYKAKLAALKAEQLSAGGAYSSDPLACSGCAAGCFRCRSSAGVVLPERMEVPGPLWKDARQPYGNPLNAANIRGAELFNLAIDEIARLNPCRAQAVQICKLGMYGAAYDAPDTCRAYTYAAQPGDDIAYRLGDCLRAAHCDGGGDFIDFGLALLRRLQDKGFGVFQIAAAPSAKKESGDE